MKALFDKNAVVEDLPGIMLLSHGSLALGMHESVQMLSMGMASQNVAAFCLEEGDDLDAYRAALCEAVSAFSGNCLIFVDLFGGSPSNQTLLASQSELAGQELYAIAGMSLPLVLSAVLSREGSDAASLHAQVLEEAPLAVVDMTAAMSQLTADVEDDDDEDDDD